MKVKGKKGEYYVTGVEPYKIGGVWYDYWGPYTVKLDTEQADGAESAMEAAIRRMGDKYDPAMKYQTADELNSRDRMNMTEVPLLDDVQVVQVVVIVGGDSQPGEIPVTVELPPIIPQRQRTLFEC